MCSEFCENTKIGIFRLLQDLILSLNNLKILWPKVTKNLMNLRKKFCESPPRDLAWK